jgi:hypothetical protein
MKNYEELFALAKKLKEAASIDEIEEPLKAIEEVVTQVSRSFSSSWLGYHSRVYYADLAPTPPGAHFSQEWGLGSRLSSLGSRGDWQEFDPEEVKSYWPAPGSVDARLS